MAGYRTLWANEFIPAAQESYKANFPNSILDCRDIRQVKAEDILCALKLEKGQLDVFEGSPPCTSFSMAGKREKNWGKVTKYSDTKQRSDDLFFDFVRILDGLQPKVFTAENVVGLAIGSALGYFKEIFSALESTGYIIEARILDAQWLGVPQARKRIFFQGVRKDLGKNPVWPKPFPYRYSVKDALPWIVEQGDNCKFGERRMREATKPSGTIGASPNTGNGKSNPSQVSVQIGEIGYGECGSTRKFGSKRSILQPCVTITGTGGGGTDRNNFKIQIGEIGHGGWNPKRSVDIPSPTIMAGGGFGMSKEQFGLTIGTETRQLTILEVKRLCGFPDDFILTGNFAKQWERLGNSVPPPMMRALADVIAREILL